MVAGARVCALCLDRNRAKWQEVRQGGVCPSHPWRATASGHTTCTDCLAYKRAYIARRRAGGPVLPRRWWLEDDTLAMGPRSWEGLSVAGPLELEIRLALDLARQGQRGTCTCYGHQACPACTTWDQALAEARQAAARTIPAVASCAALPDPWHEGLPLGGDVVWLTL